MATASSDAGAVVMRKVSLINLVFLHCAQKFEQVTELFDVAKVLPSESVRTESVRCRVPPHHQSLQPVADSGDSVDHNVMYKQQGERIQVQAPS